MKQTNEVKLVRLRDLVCYHASKLKPNCTLGEIDDLEHDINVWAKNLLLSLEDLDATAEIKWIGDNHTEKGAVVTD
jgi:hypothetical protein